MKALNILLACNAGMSTSIMARKIREAATAEGYEATVTAVPYAEADEFYGMADAVLLGPQIRYAEKDVRAKASCPVLVMNMQDYGTMNGKKMFHMVLDALAKA